MNPAPKRTARMVERSIHRSNRVLEDIIVQTPEEVDETQAIYGKTPCECPESLEDAAAVLERIIAGDQETPEPSAFGKTVTLMRTQKKLSVEELARETDLDVEDIEEIECGHATQPDPMIVVTIAEHFKVPVEKMQRLAGLTRQSDLNDEFDSLHLAAGAKPEFDQHSREERKLLLRWIKNFRK